MTDMIQFNPGNFGELIEFAKMVSTTQIIPQAYLGKPDDIVAAVIMGADVGLTPMQSLQNIAVIRGKATIWGDGLLAICQGHPAYAGIREWLEGAGSPEATAYCRIKRAVHGEIEETTQSFSVAQAKRANLWGNKGPWSQYPERMLQMRARAFALRDSFSDALKGFLPAEEVRDYNDEPARIQQVEAPPEVKAVLMPPKKEEKPKPKKARTPAGNRKSFNKAKKSFEGCGISEDQLLAFLKIEAPVQCDEAMTQKLRDAFIVISRGQLVDGLLPPTLACSDELPPHPGEDMAGLE